MHVYVPGVNDISLFTSRLRHGHRLGCDVVVLVVLLGHLAFGLTF